MGLKKEYDVLYLPLYVVSSIGILSNLMLLFAFLKDPLKCFRNSGTYLVGNLAFCDMLFSLSVVVAASLKDEKIQFFLQFLSFYSSMITIFSIALDRFLMINYPFKHRFLMSGKKMAFWIFSIWLISVIHPVKLIFLHHKADTPIKSTIGMILIMVTGTLYCKTYFALKKQQRSMAGRKNTFPSRTSGYTSRNGSSVENVSCVSDLECVENEIHRVPSQHDRAQSQRDRAQNQRDRPQSDRAQNQSDRAQSQSYRAQTQSDRAQSQSNRAQSQSQSDRAQNQRDRAQSQSYRAQSQSGRAQSQSNRAQSQSNRAQSQSDRAQSGSDRAQNQGDRAQNQSDRCQSESDRAQSQNERAASQNACTQSQSDRAQTLVNRAQTQDNRTQTQDNCAQILDNRAQTQDDRAQIQDNCGQILDNRAPKQNERVQNRNEFADGAKVAKEFPQNQYRDGECESDRIKNQNVPAHSLDEHIQSRQECVENRNDRVENQDQHAQSAHKRAQSTDERGQNRNDCVENENNCVENQNKRAESSQKDCGLVNNAKEQKFLNTIIIIALIAVITVLPGTIYIQFWTISGNGQSYSIPFILVVTIFSLNFAVNPLIYCLRLKRYRKTFKIVYGCK